MKTYYRVDRDYRIVDVGGDWDDFAIRNASDECVSKYVIGDDLFSHITGDEVKMWIEAVIQAVRITQEVIERDYRCDGPSVRRYFRLVAEPEPESVVLVSNQLTAEEPQSTSIVLSSAIENHGGTPRCSICNSVRLADKWVDPFELGSNQEFQVRHEVCPRCQSKSPERFRA